MLFRATARDGKVRINWGEIRHLTNFMKDREYDSEDAESAADQLEKAANKIRQAADDIKSGGGAPKMKNQTSPRCEKHGSVMTFGRYSKSVIFMNAHTKFDGNTYYCNECVNELQPEYERYTRQYK